MGPFSMKIHSLEYLLFPLYIIFRLFSINTSSIQIFTFVTIKIKLKEAICKMFSKYFFTEIVAFTSKSQILDSKYLICFMPLCITEMYVQYDQTLVQYCYTF